MLTAVHTVQKSKQVSLWTAHVLVTVMGVPKRSTKLLVVEQTGGDVHPWQSSRRRSLLLVLLFLAAVDGIRCIVGPCFVTKHLHAVQDTLWQML